MSRWFRYYTEALTDPKVQCLDGEVFKTWVNLLCVASKTGGKLPVIHELSYLLSSRSDKITRHVNELVKRGLLDAIDDHFEPHNWLTRQYKSDTSAPRTKAWRDRQRDVTQAVTETVPDNRVQNTETEKKDLVALSAPSKKVSRRTNRPIPEDWKPTEQHAHLARSLSVDVADTEQRFRDYCASTGKLYADHDAAFRNFIKNAPKFNGGPNGHRGSRALQDDSKSISRAAERLAELAERGEFSFGPRPSLLPEDDARPVQLLSKG